MSENHESTEAVETVEISDEDIAGFIEHGGQGEDGPSFHPILEVWREVLKPARKELSAKVTPQWASRIIGSYTGIGFADMEDFRDVYFTKLLQLADMVDAEIATDDECLSYTTPEEDVENNSVHYRNLLRDWQLAVMGWELEWETTNPLAAVELGAISEVHKMFFGPTGVTAMLDNIRFEFTEADQAELAEALETLREGK
jgi:hypothetical protein